MRNGPGLPGTARTVSVGRRRGFTLLELLIVTVIIGILAMIASASYQRVRQKAMIAAAKTDMRNAMEAIERYETVNGSLPQNIGDLAEVGWKHSPDVNFCTFELRQGTDPYIFMQDAYRASQTMIESRYPLWGVRMDEKPNNRKCTSSVSGSSNKKNKNNGKHNGRGGPPVG